MHYISVILPLKIDWEPYYSCPEPLEVGERVRVLFSRKEYAAVVSGTDIVPDVDPEKVKPILSVEKELKKISTNELELWRQVSKYYMCSVGEVYKAAYPSGKVNLEESRNAARARMIQRKEKVANAIEAKLARLNLRLDRKTWLADKAKDGTKAKAGHLADIDKINTEIERVRATLTAAREAVGTVKSKAMTSHTGPSRRIELSEAQTRAYKEIIAGFKAGKPVLLHGVTGSGKTEIYMKLAQNAIDSGTNVLYLVPEIALSRQLEDRLRQQFAERLITFHSGESAASRQDSAETIRNTTAENGGYIALCTRSGLFLPHHDLGLIIVDEEHDRSYKQDSPAPRYNGRDTALMLSRLHNGCSIILGSATPSLEELYNARNGRHAYVRISEKFYGSEDADIDIIDTKEERRKRGMEGSFSRRLIAHIYRELQEGGQVLILRSRRAWASVLQCEECGEILRCPHCNVSMSYHKAAGRMICHYCRHTMPFSGKCTKCGGVMTTLGAGTQKIEEETAGLFPQARIARLDSDSAQDKKYEAKVIMDFSAGDIDILVGTQIITKGFDFSRLGLVAVIAADTLLGIQDFRADEKALHMLEQFRGRCGRRGKKGLLVIQTSRPEHPIYQNMTNNSPDLMNSQLLRERQDFGFPPYSRIIEITIKDTYADRAERMAQLLTDMLKGFDINGPYSPPVDRIAEQHIRKLRISLKKDRQLTSKKDSLKAILNSFEKSQKYEGHVTVDVDPL